MLERIKKWIIHHILFPLIKKNTPSSIFTFIYSINYWGSRESRSGFGSEKHSTEYIRKEMMQIISDYKILSILDLPCGDCNWIKPEKLGIKYIGGDIVKKIIKKNKMKYNQEINFYVLDITNSPLPTANLILCRECLQHLSYENIKNALINIKKSQIKYLLITSYPHGENKDIENGHFFEINLEQEPFNLPPPLKKIEEIGSNKLLNRTNKQHLYLYDLDELRKVQ